MNLLDFIKVYDNVVPDYLCDNIIELFDSHPTVLRDNDTMLFDEIVIDSSHGSILSNLQDVIQYYALEYRRDLNLDEWWPPRYGIEQCRAKRYEPNIGYFNDHVDISDYNSARRFVAFLLYLNDGEGGDTEFVRNDEVVYTCKRTKGSLLVFPPLWLYPHRGTKPINQPKYIVSSYLHYLSK